MQLSINIAVKDHKELEDVLKKLGLSATGGKKPPKDEEPAADEPAADEPAGDDEPNLDDLEAGDEKDPADEAREVMQQVIEKKGKDFAKKLLLKFGSAKLSEIDADKLPKLIAAAKKYAA